MKIECITIKNESVLIDAALYDWLCEQAKRYENMMEIPAAWAIRQTDTGGWSDDPWAGIYSDRQAAEANAEALAEDTGHRFEVVELY